MLIPLFVRGEGFLYLFQEFDLKENKEPLSTAKDIEKTILEKGVDFVVSVNKKNIFHKLGILQIERKFVIHPLVIGTLLKISNILININNDKLKGAIEEEKATKKVSDDILNISYESIAESSEKIIRIIAHAIHNSESDPPRRLIRFLKKNLKPTETLKLLNLIIKQMDINSFLACLVSMKGMNIHET